MNASRRPDIDNLRSAATFLLLAFHTAKVYDYSPFYHVKNHASFQGFDVFTAFVHQWHMPLFFVLSGWSMAAMLRRRTARQVRAERVKRLLVPFFCFGLTACVWIGWVEAHHTHDRPGEFAGSPATIGGVAVTWSHLWFLVYLFTFSLLYLPHFVRLGERTADPVVNRRTLWKYLGVMIAIQVCLRWLWPGQQNLVWDWANFAYYSSFFIGGFYVGRFASVAALIDEHRGVMTRLGLFAAACQVPFWLRLVVIEDASDWKAYLVYQVLSAVAGVGLVIGILGWAKRRFVGTGRVHAWAKDRAFPVYLVHQACVVAAALPVIRTSWPFAVKFSATLALATVMTVVITEVLVRVDVLAPALGRDRRAVGRDAARLPA